MKKLAIPFCIALIFLSACTTQQPAPVPQVLAPETTKVDIPSSVLLKCPPIPKLENRKYTDAELVAFINNITNISEACRSKQSILSDTTRKAFNIPAPTTAQTGQNTK